VIACLSHNLLRWTEQLGLPNSTARAARTIRRRLLALPGRLTTTLANGHSTSQHAGPGSRTSPKRSTGSERSRRRLTHPGRSRPPSKTRRTPRAPNAARKPASPGQPNPQNADQAPSNTPSPQPPAPAATATASTGPTQPAVDPGSAWDERKTDEVRYPASTLVTLVSAISPTGQKPCLTS